MSARRTARAVASPAAQLLREPVFGACRYVRSDCPSTQASETAPMLNAACTGSSWNCVPGTLAPLGTTVPGTIGPSSLVQAGYDSASSPQPSVSIRQCRAVSYASLLVTLYLTT